MITGYRRYLISDHRFEGLETGLFLSGAQNPWPEREFEATCNRDWTDVRPRATFRVSTQRSPELCADHLEQGLCTCGIYVMKKPDGIGDYHNWPVLAAVTGWGNYIEFEHGWRLQHVRIEHLWIEPDQFRLYDELHLIGQLEARYKVKAEPRTKAICCGSDHEMVYWESKQGPIAICQMATSHIVNVMKYLEGSTGRRTSYGAKWKRVFEKELERRAPRKGADGKVKVFF